MRSQCIAISGCIGSFKLHIMNITGFFVFVSLYFQRWSSEIKKMDLRFGLYVKFPPENRLQGLETEIHVLDSDFSYLVEEVQSSF